MFNFIKGLALALLILVVPAHADTWLPPRIVTYTSADGTARVTITPRPLDGALPYFRDKVEGKNPAGQRTGSAQLHPLAKLERREGKQWRTVWTEPLVNDVGPVHALVSDGGRFLVTFDNWHSAGYGDDTVVIYDAAGKMVRKFSLEDFLPADFLPLLRRSVSSVWWGGEHTLEDDDDILVLRVLEPKEQHSFDKDPDTAPVRIRLSDGQVLPLEGPEWERTRQVIDALNTERKARWEEARALRALPLPVPEGSDKKAWRAYLVELRERLSDDTGHPHAGDVLSPEELKGGDSDRFDTLTYLLDSYTDEVTRTRDHFIVVAPDSQALAGVLASHLSGMKPGALQGATIAFVGTAEQGEQVRAAAARSGAAIVLIDRAVPYPPGTLPEAVPEWFL